MNCVYIARDIAGVVLYVGSTGNLSVRKRDHARDKAWWDEVADIETIETENRAAAYDLERRTILNLNPKYNRRGSTPAKVIARNENAPAVVMRLDTWAALIANLSGPERLLADQLGVNYMTFSNYKRGVANPSGKFIASAIVATGLSFDELFHVKPGAASAEEWVARRARAS
jgi:hypothetical protein